MSRSIVIPSDRGSRITVVINGKEYVYAAGATVTVPDEVAAVIADMLAMDPGGTRGTANEELLAGVEEEIAGVAGDLATLDGKVDGLDTRLTALDDETDGIVPDHETRITALEAAAET